MPVTKVDVVVLGSGPGGQRAAVQAAKLGKRVAVVERMRVVGGGCINTGTIPSSRCVSMSPMFDASTLPSMTRERWPASSRTVTVADGPSLK